MNAFSLSQRRQWLLGILWALLTLCPVNRLLLRASWLALTAGMLAWLLWRGRRSRSLRWLLVAVIVSAGGWFTVGSRPVTTPELRAAYVQALAGYAGVSYLWGGESRLGIDCSGLVRRGFIDANLWLGLTHGNAAAVATAVRLWWHDQSAAALRDGEAGTTVAVMDQVTLNTLGGDMLQPGDIMVTASGIHCMVYLGDSRWLQADPTRGLVFAESVPSRTNPWYASPAQIVRWRQLAV